MAIATCFKKCVFNMHASLCEKSKYDYDKKLPISNSSGLSHARMLNYRNKVNKWNNESYNWCSTFQLSPLRRV